MAEMARAGIVSLLPHIRAFLYVLRRPTLLPSRQAPLDASERQYPPALSYSSSQNNKQACSFHLQRQQQQQPHLAPRAPHYAARRFPLPPPPGRSFQRPGGHHRQPCRPVLQGVRASPPGRSHLPRFPTISANAIAKRDLGVTTRAS